eukprot:571581-Rhodomonas_salina.1
MPRSLAAQRFRTAAADARGHIRGTNCTATALQCAATGDRERCALVCVCRVCAECIRRGCVGCRESLHLCICAVACDAHTPDSTWHARGHIRGTSCRELAFETTLSARWSMELRRECFVV